MIRVGIGYDSHKFEKERKLKIGGIEIPYLMGLAGHSDGDVLLHAICDAMLGACAMGNIGDHFPDTGKEWENIDSSIILQKVHKMVEEKGFKIRNIDCVIIAEEPRLSPYTEKMKHRIAEILKIDKGRVEIKPKRNEGMGFIGRKEGIAAIAVVLVEEE